MAGPVCKPKKHGTLKDTADLPVDGDKIISVVGGKAGKCMPRCMYVVGL